MLGGLVRSAPSPLQTDIHDIDARGAQAGVRRADRRRSAGDDQSLKRNLSSTIQQSRPREFQTVRDKSLSKRRRWRPLHGSCPRGSIPHSVIEGLAATPIVAPEIRVERFHGRLALRKPVRRRGARPSFCFVPHNDPASSKGSCLQISDRQGCAAKATHGLHQTGREGAPRRPERKIQWRVSYAAQRLRHVSTRPSGPQPLPGSAQRSQPSRHKRCRCRHLYRMS